CRLVEVDRHVAAEYGVERSLHWPGSDQVERLERDQVAYGGGHADRTVPKLFQLLRTLRTEPAQLIFRVNPQRCLGDDRGINVGAQDLEVPALELRKGREQIHADRIGLLAGGAACRPDAQPAAARLLGDQPADIGTQMLEMMV